MSSDKQPLMQGQVPGPSAPPPAYKPPTAPPYAPPSQPGYPHQGYAPHQGYTAPPQPGYGGMSQQNNNNTTVIMQPAQHRTVVMEIKPPNYIVLSVITMIFFCWIFGLIGLVIGSQVESAWMRGDRIEAHRRSQQARIWNIVGMVVGVVTYVIIVTVSVAVNVSANSYYNGDY